MKRVLIVALLLLPAASPLRAQSAADSTRAHSTMVHSMMADSTMTDSTMATAYRVFHADGRTATLDDILAAMEAVDVVFLGEQHDDPVAHYLQAELLTRAYAHQAGSAATPRPLALSLEMFERDVQPILDEYLAGLITESHFLRSSRPWQNYKTDYRPLVEFARAHRLRVLAANAPRRYVNRVSRLGPSSLDTLSAWARSLLPPLPYPGPSPEYEAKWTRMMAEMMAPKEPDEEHAAPGDSTAGHRSVAPDTTARHPAQAADTAATHTHRPMDPAARHEAGAGEEDAPDEDPEEQAAPPHVGAYMVDAQAFWDASMAYSIYQHLRETPGALVLHVGGSFHVEEGLGMPAKLDGYRPGTRRLIVVIKAEDPATPFDAEAYGALGDFVILTDESRPRSFEPSLGG